MTNGQTDEWTDISCLQVTFTAKNVNYNRNLSVAASSILIESF